MSRPLRGAVVEHVGKDKRTYRTLRFAAYGKRRTVPLGTVSEEEAQRELEYVVEQVRRGVWQPPRVVEPHGRRPRAARLRPGDAPRRDEKAALRALVEAGITANRGGRAAESTPAPTDYESA